MNGAFSKKSVSRFLPRVAVSKRAFTIVELIIVITVIGILTAIVTISYDAVLTNSREESMKADLQSTYAKLKLYKDANGEYPASLGANEVNSDDGTTLSYVPSSDGLSFCVTSSRLDTTKTFSVDKTGTVREGAFPASVAAATPESCFTTAMMTGKITIIGYNGYGMSSQQGQNPECPNDVVIPSTVTSISSGAFDANQLGVVTIPSSVATISASFAGNDNVTCRIPTGKTFTTAGTGCKTIVTY